MRRLDIWFLFCIGVVLALPTAGLVWTSARMLATGAISTAAADGRAQGWAAGTDVFIATNHGFRKNMVQIHHDIRNALSGQSPRVLHGSDGWLFLTDSDVISQATGQRVDIDGVQRFVEMAVALAAEARTNGRRFVVAIAPNKHTIYREKLPHWARAVPVRTELDVLMAALARAGVEAVDLRPALLQRAASRPVYHRGDTHWTKLGAVIAFNEIVRTLGFGDEAVDLDSGFGPDVLRDHPGDLVSLAKIAGPWPQMVPVPRDGTFVPDDALERRVIKTVANNEFHSLVRRGPPPGPAAPRVLVIGDSFTARLFGPLFMRFAAEYVWIHNLGGAIDMPLIGARDPDIVVLEVVERSIPFLRFRPADAAPRS